MFIYHFSRLIKSKLLWGFLALLMVFAFVVMDSCSGSSVQQEASAGYWGEAAIARKTMEDAAQTANLLSGNSRFYLPQRSQFFAMILNGEDAPDAGWTVRRRQNWRLLAAREVAVRNGMEMSVAGGNRVLETMFADGNGVFNPDRYRAFLSMNQYTKGNLFETTFANVWLPAQTATVGVFNAVGWVSPMEQEFALNAAYDSTTAYAASLKNAIALDSIAVPEADLNAWYAAHPQSYELPEQRNITYVELPVASFAEKITVEELDAMQYYDDNSSEFMGTGTNANKVLPFEEVKDKALEKVKTRRALEEALLYANETLVAAAQSTSFAEAVKPYGEIKAATVRIDQPIGFQNARDVVAAAFEMDPSETPFNAVSGTDRVYFIRLENVIPAHVAPYDTVKERVLADARRDRLALALKEKGAAIRATLAAELAKGTAFDAAVAACQVEGLTATTGMTFVLDEAANIEMPYRQEVLRTAAELGEKMLSEALVTPANEIVLVYVAERKAGDVLAKTTAKSQLSESLSWGTKFRVATDWMKWLIATTPPTADGTVPVLDEDIVSDDPEE